MFANKINIINNTVSNANGQPFFGSLSKCFKIATRLEKQDKIHIIQCFGLDGERERLEKKMNHLSTYVTSRANVELSDSKFYMILRGTILEIHPATITMSGYHAVY